MKWVILLALIGIVAALASAGAFMLRHRRAGLDAAEGSETAPPDRQMARALAVRIAISVALFLFVLLGWLMGWVHPGGLPAGG